MPDALEAAHVRRGWSRRSLILLFWLTLVLPVQAALGQERYYSFDMPEQPLATALVDFADRTGMASLVDGELAKGLRSSTVKGRLPAPDALRILLAGTGLSIRYGSANAFTVGPIKAEQADLAVESQTAHYSNHAIYFSRLQKAVERVLCRSDNTRPGRYRAAFQIWIGKGGAVQAVHLLGSTGDETRDAAITTRLTSDGVAPPPQDLPQPLTIVLQKKAAIADAVCAEVPGLQP